MSPICLYPVSRVLTSNRVKIVRLITQTQCHMHTQGDVSQSCKQLLSGVYLGHVKACGKTVADSPSFQGLISHSYRVCPSAEPDADAVPVQQVLRKLHAGSVPLLVDFLGYFAPRNTST